MRLIDADALDYGFPMTDDVYGLSRQIGIEMVKARINEAPTIEAEPVRHGVWGHSASMVCSAKCSECRMWITKHSVNEPDFRYCPHCGAKMDGEQK